MVNFGEKAKIRKAGNLNEGRSYVITTVHIGFLGTLRDSSKELDIKKPPLEASMYILM